jgi:hypothetical protein
MAKPKQSRNKAGTTQVGNVVTLGGAVVAAAVLASGNNGEPPLMDRIADWKRSIERNMEEFTTLAVDAFKHAMPQSLGGHGNCTPLLTLQNAMPKALRKIHFAAHVAKFSPVKMSNEDKATSNYTKVELRKPDDKLYREWNLEGFMANDFFAEAEAVKPMDLERFDPAAQLLKDMRTLASLIFNDGKKERHLKTGQTEAEAGAKLSTLQKGYNAFVAAKLANPLEPETAKRIKDAIEKTKQAA